MSELRPKFIPIADHALLVEFADQISAEANEMVIRLDKAIYAEPPFGLVETIPALVNILIKFDPLVTDHQAIKKTIQNLWPLESKPLAPPKHHSIDVCYDLELAPDIKTVAEVTGHTVEEVISIHTGAKYHVGMYGFAPGYAYLAGVPTAIQVPRKQAPVRDIPKGSVMIAGAQCLTTTLMMPTGWSIIGRTNAEILSTTAQDPFLFDVGDTVSFRRINRAEFDKTAKDQAQ
jgi:inhibitor of KinA